MFRTTFLKKARKHLVLALALLGCAASEANAQMNPYMLTDPYSRRAELWDRVHNVPFNYSLAYNRAKEAGRDMNGILRNEVDFGYIVTTADYSFRHYTNTDMQGGSEPTPVTDTSFTLTVKPKKSFHFGSSTAYPLATLNNDAAVLIASGLFMEYIDFTQPDFTINGKAEEYSMKTIGVGAPITIDFKTGADALLDVSKRTCFTLGAGIQPLASVATNNLDVSWCWNLQPMAKVEFGIATKFAAFKLRATGYLGNRSYVHYSGTHFGIYNFSQDIDIKGKNQFIISLVVMPMASKWENNEWYRGGR